MKNFPEFQSIPAVELVEKVKKCEMTSKEIIESVFKIIDEYEPEIRAFINLFYDEAIKKAKEIDEKNMKKEPTGKLAGIPISIKDNICVKNMPTTCASSILKDYISPYNATVIEKLEKEDAIIIGKTNMDEFAMGSSTENSAFKITRNPWNVEMVPGGSSGGSAASVAMRYCLISLGSDTGGSIRQPASFCGVLGLKPTYGRVSRYGLVAFASSLDQIGPFSVFAKDLALLLEVISGHDELDSTSANITVPEYHKIISPDIRNLKFGVPKEYFVEGIDKEVRDSIENSIKLVGNEAEVIDISLPHTKYAVSTYYIIAPSEASSNLARYDGVKYGLRVSSRGGNESEPELIRMYKETRNRGFGNEVKRRIMLGTYALSAGYYDAYYLKAQKVRNLIKSDFDDAFKLVDVILTPTSPTPPFKIGEKIQDPLSMYLSDIFTIPANLAGLPAISIPCGFTEAGLPIGLQAITNYFEEEKLLNLALFFEEKLKLYKRLPQ